MRRQHFQWTYLVLSLVLTIYGSYSLIYNHVKGKGLSILGLVFLIIGLVLLVLYFVLVIVTFVQKKKPVFIKETPKEEKPEEPVAEKIEENKPVKENKPVGNKIYASKKEATYSSSRPSKSRYDYDSTYVRLVGYGPVLRVTGPEILDMRTNIYYRIEGNIVKQLGGGPVYEISGNQIKLAFGGYLYEITGSNVNKVFGGYYASISGGCLTTFDLKEKYEIDNGLTLKQQLTVVALLFGTY